MRNLTEENLTEAVLKKYSDTPDPRLKILMSSFISHLHDFIREVEPTDEEWFKAISFITDIGQTCTDVRQETILWSDTLGASMLVEAINNRRAKGASDSSVLGPFHQDDSPKYESGVDISGDTEGLSVRMSGRVLDLNGRPVVNACLDVWQNAPNGLYAIQDPDQDKFNLRGKLFSDENGYYEFLTLKPIPYSIPDDGPVGDMLKATAVHPWRPAHIHFIVTAEGYKSVVTQLFSENDEYLETDAVFGVKDSLVIDYQVSSEEECYQVNYDFVLELDE